MNESQVYKWFWEQRNKEDERQDEQKLAAVTSFDDLSDEQKFEVFVSKALRQHRDHVDLQGFDGTGRPLTEDELLTSVKLHTHAVKNRADYDDLA